MRNNRQLSLEISRIKAPKRRRTPPQSKPELKYQSESKTSVQIGLSALERFQPIPNEVKKQIPGPIRNITASALNLHTFDPVLTFQQACTCPQRHSNNGIHICNPTPKSASPAALDISIGSKDSSVEETYTWLINSGVPFSAFDPVAIDPLPCASSDLYDCADEITSLFSFGVSPILSSTPANISLITTDTLTSPISDPSFGINEADASLVFPQDMLGELSTAIWGP